MHISGSLQVPHRPARLSRYNPDKRESVSRLPPSFAVFFRHRLWRRSPTRRGGGSPKPGAQTPPKNPSGISLRGRWVSFPQEGECGMCSVFEEGVLRVERVVVVVVVVCAFETVPDSTPTPPPPPNIIGWETYMWCTHGSRWKRESHAEIVAGAQLETDCGGANLVALVSPYV